MKGSHTAEVKAGSHVCHTRASLIIKAGSASRWERAQRRRFARNLRFCAGGVSAEGERSEARPKELR